MDTFDISKKKEIIHDYMYIQNAITTLELCY